MKPFRPLPAVPRHATALAVPSALRIFLILLLSLGASACSSDDSVAEPQGFEWPYEISIPAGTAELVFTVGHGELVLWSEPTIRCEFEHLGVTEDGSAFGDLRFAQHLFGSVPSEELTEEFAEEQFRHIPRVQEYHANGLSWLASYRAWVDDRVVRLPNALQQRVGVELRDQPFDEQLRGGTEVLESSGLVVIGSVRAFPGDGGGASDSEEGSLPLCESDGDLLFDFQYIGWARSQIPVWTVSTPPPPRGDNHFTEAMAQEVVETIQLWLNGKPTEGFVMRVEISGGGVGFRHTRPWGNPVRGER